MEVENPVIAARDRLADLPAGWDSYETPRIHEASRKVAKDCLHQIRRLLGAHYAKPVVGPTRDGGVALIWRKAQGSEIDLPCSPSGARYLALAPNRQVVGQSGPFMDCNGRRKGEPVGFATKAFSLGRRKIDSQLHGRSLRRSRPVQQLRSQKPDGRRGEPDA